MIDAAVEDHVVTPDEYDQMCRAAALLEVEIGLVDRRTDGLRSTTDTVTLTTGMTVCFTGAPTDEYGDEIPRSKLQRLASEIGMIPVKDVTASACQLLVAADPASRSGKAAKARKFGIPIAGVDDFRAGLSTRTLTVSKLSAAGVALVCSKCGDSWLATQRSSNPICPDCKQKERGAQRRLPAPAPPMADGTPSTTLAAPDADAGVESLVCVDCGVTWQRRRVRGRKPQRCANCR